ncbi:MAG TPA: hypothetical protein VGC80_01500 [Acetobacteraceae bacterium]
MKASDLLVGLMMVALGLVGLVMAAGALDSGIYVFGMSLFGFACVFVLGQVRRHFDEVDAARAVAREGRHV